MLILNPLCLVVCNLSRIRTNPRTCEWYRMELDQSQKVSFAETIEVIGHLVDSTRVADSRNGLDNEVAKMQKCNSLGPSPFPPTWPPLILPIVIAQLARWHGSVLPHGDGDELLLTRSGCGQVRHFPPPRHAPIPPSSEL